MFKQDFGELKVYLGTLLTFGSWLVSYISMDIVKDIITIFVGLSTLIYTIFKILSEISKRKFYKRIEKEKKDESSNREI